MSRAGLTLTLVLAAGVPLARVDADAPPSQSEIEEALTCQCGCGLTVHSCNHLQCPSGEPIKDEIRSRIAAGETRDTILAAFASKYGEKVLSSPTMQGFNWLAWITPFAALLLAGTVLVVVVRSRLHRTVLAAPGGGTLAGTDDPAIRARLDRELADLDRES